jgi:DNA-binding transcriptional MerR regulator
MSRTTAANGPAPVRADAIWAEETLSIAEVAARTGLSADTLRYYERADLIQPVDRSAGGQRRYAAADMAWLEFLLRLRATGMSIANMQRFGALRRGGDDTVGERLDLLRVHRAVVERQIEGLRTNVAALTNKIGYYEDLLDQQAGREKR